MRRAHQNPLMGIAVGLFGLAVPLASTQAAYTDLGTSGWEYEVQAGIAGTLEGIGSAGDTTSFTLKADFGASSDRVIIRFKSKAATSERERFFMMGMELQHSVPWCEVEIELTDNLEVKQGVGSRDHPDEAHIHVKHSTGGGPNNDRLTPDPNIFPGVTHVLYRGRLEANDPWKPERLRLHDMSSTAYDFTAGDARRNGPMDFYLEVGPTPCVPEPGSTALLLATGSGALVLIRRRREGATH